MSLVQSRFSEQSNRWFDISPFVVPVGRFGNLGRNVVIGPGFNNTDFSVIKRTKLTESQLIEFRWEVFDLVQPREFRPAGPRGRNCKLRTDHEHAFSDG